MSKFLNIGIDSETIPFQDEETIQRVRTMAEASNFVAPAWTKAAFGEKLELEKKLVDSLQLDGLKAMYLDRFKAVLVEEKVEEIRAKSSFSAGEGGEIVSVSVKTLLHKNESGEDIMTDPLTLFRFNGQQDLTEAMLLKRLVDWFCAIEDYAAQGGLKARFVGANVMGFDMRFIAQRCAILGVQMPRKGFTWAASAYDRSRYFDVLDVWSFGDKTNRPSLDRLCRYLNIDTSKYDEQGKIDGSMVWPIWRDEGQDGAERIARYNARDVRVLEPILERLLPFVGE